MMNIEIIGQNSNKINSVESEMVKRIIDSYSKDLSEDELRENQMTGLKLRMNNYLNESVNSQLINTGEFLNEILTIYKIRKNKFAKFIEIEEPNLHAILKGRRKINNKIAKKLELTFEIDEHLWLFIETKNEIKKFNLENKLSQKKYSINVLVN